MLVLSDVMTIGALLMGEVEEKFLTISEICGMVAVKQLDRRAVVYGKDVLSYSELESQSSRISGGLIAAGLRPGAVVAVCLSPFVLLPAVILGIWKAGGVYLPIDMEGPLSRTAYLLQDSQASFCIAEGEGIQSVSKMQACSKLLTLSEIMVDDYNEFIPPMDAESAAYVIYTSGTTGLPKGVLGTHRALITRLLWMQSEFDMQIDDVMLCKAALTFDVSIWEMFWPLIVGAGLVILEKDRRIDWRYIHDLILEESVTYIQFVPSLLNQFLEYYDNLRHLPLKKVFSGGESLFPVLQKKFFAKVDKGVELHNIYAPTEFFGSLHHHCVASHDNLINCIGKPSKGVEAYIVNSELQSVPDGEVGELCLAGYGIAQGYINSVNLSRRKFIKNRLSNVSEKLYVTGDKVRRLPDKSIEYLGRVDDQIKHFGVRLEPAEVEYYLDQHPSIERSVLVQVPMGGEVLLCVFYLGIGVSISSDVCRDYLSRFIPAAIIPAEFIRMDAFPVGEHGKVDREALRKVGGKILERKDSSFCVISSLTKNVAQILSKRSCDINDDFAFNSVTSLQLMQLHASLMRIIPHGVRMVDLFSFRTFGQMKEYVAKEMGV
ncbi:MAG: amino acid adenylation domain-containing protein [Gammaproteobacteria bacterium]|nr:amino acid adenylation domain-containing protein [Gammaproteobacteria bacterium]